jgi:RNA polymerase II subunit A-like phosphatase
MVHNNVSLTISQNEATKVEDEAKRRLLAAKKLSLVVDLDQTIIHATVDPTVAEWQKDETNPNHAAVKDVRAFQLVDEGPGARNCWYYIKLRPGLQDFLKSVSKLYELHIYTMGTRAYAQNIATIIDPERKIFGDRILSRDESGSLVAKNLQRLFPVDTKMVVIIDDRGDVWNWNENLIKVTPYDFFVGIGDINSSFLPKKPGDDVTSKMEAIAQSSSDRSSGDSPVNDAVSGVSGDEPEQENESSSSGSSSKNVSALEQLVSMGGGDDPITLQARTNQQDETFTAQLQNRPLLQKQLKLEAEDAAGESSAVKDFGELDPAASDRKAHENPHKLLQDYDQELLYLENALRKVHTEYFDAYSRQLANAPGSRIAELRGSSKRKQPLSDQLDLALVPDIKKLMPQMKLRVLEGVVLVFSGVIPLHLDWQTNDITLWARNFGAKVERDVGRRTTHVVAARNRTAKVRQALRRGKGKIKVVSPAWLMGSIARWQRLDESDYLLSIDESDSASVKGGAGDDDEILSESEDPPSGIETEDDSSYRNDNENPRRRPFLTVAVNDLQDEESDLEGVIPADLEDDQSPVGGTNEDWSAMHDELAEFLGSEAEDSDTDSMASSESRVASVRGMKRSYEGSSDNEDAQGGANAPAKGRKRQALGRVSSLSQLMVPGVGENADSETGLPTPEITAGEEGEGEGEWEGEGEGDGDGEGNKEDGDGGDPEKKDDEDEDIDRREDEKVAIAEHDDWSDFEEELEAEMERVASENQGAG